MEKCLVHVGVDRAFFGFVRTKTLLADIISLNLAILIRILNIHLLEVNIHSTRVKKVKI